MGSYQDHIADKIVFVAQIGCTDGKGATMKVKTGLVAGQRIGDAAANLAEFTGAKRLGEMYERITGKPCGCNERQERLNQLTLHPPGFILTS